MVKLHISGSTTLTSSFRSVDAPAAASTAVAGALSVGPSLVPSILMYVYFVSDAPGDTPPCTATEVRRGSRPSSVWRSSYPAAGWNSRSWRALLSWAWVPFRWMTWLGPPSGSVIWLMTAPSLWVKISYSGSASRFTPVRLAMNSRPPVLALRSIWTRGHDVVS